MPESPHHHHHGGTGTPPPAPGPGPAPTPVPSSALFFDDFTGAAGSLPSSANWVISNIPFSEDPTDGSANYVVSPYNSYQDGDSHLVLAVTSPAGATLVKPARGAYNSARLATFDSMNGGNVKFAASWGTFSARMQIAPAQGWWPAFWTTGTNITTWPYCGELDISETFGPGGGAMYQSYANVNGPMGNGDNYGYGDDEQMATPATIETGFHVYSVTIPQDYSQVSFAYDGTTYATVTKEQWLAKAGEGAQWVYGPDTPQGIILNVDVGSNVDPAGVGYPSASQQLPAAVLTVDWIQVTQP